MISCDIQGKMVIWELFGDDDTPEMVATGVKPPIFVPPTGRIMVGHCSLSNKEWGTRNLFFLKNGKNGTKGKKFWKLPYTEKKTVKS